MAEYDPNVDVYTEVVEADISESFTFIQDVKLQEKTATQNGVVTPDAGKDGLSKVTVAVPLPSGSIEITQNGTHDVTMKETAVVDVPNSYTTSDEGKVVQSGALVAQTSQSITGNGTYDTTTNDEVVVDVQGGGDNRVMIADGKMLRKLMDGSNWSNGAYAQCDYMYKPTGSLRTDALPYNAFMICQNDNVYFYKSGDEEAYSRINRGNNKNVIFLTEIPVRCQTLYLEIAADAGSESYPISQLTLVDGVGLTGFYAGEHSGSTLKNYVLTDTSVPATQEGLTLTRTSARVVPRQIAQIDLSSIDVPCYFLYFGCRSYFDIYNIWAE